MSIATISPESANPSYSPRAGTLHACTIAKMTLPFHISVPKFRTSLFVAVTCAVVCSASAPRRIAMANHALRAESANRYVTILNREKLLDLAGGREFGFEVNTP